MKESMNQLMPVHARAREQEAPFQQGRRRVSTLGSHCLCSRTGSVASRTEVSVEDGMKAQEGVCMQDSFFATGSSVKRVNWFLRCN